jgi:hypothetical protein
MLTVCERWSEGYKSPVARSVNFPDTVRSSRNR